MKRLVLVGGGHAHAFVLERLARARLTDTEVLLIAPAARQIYSGMLPGWIAGAYPLDACTLPLDRLAARAGVRFVQQACVRLDAAQRTIECADGRAVAWDWLSLDVGSASAGQDIPGAAQHATPVRPLERFVERLARLLDEAAAGTAGDIVIIGGGAAGVELAFALEARLAALGRRAHAPIGLTVVDARTRPPAGLPRLLQWRAAALLRARGITWLGGQQVAAIGGNGVGLADGRRLPARHVLQISGAAAQPWLAASGLATDAQGFVRVGPTLQSVSHPRVFAAGDCATYAVPRPRSGVFAVRAGPPLAANLLRALAGEPLHAWRPQRTALYLVSAGAGHALAAWGPLVWWGEWVWRWKDRIDRAFVARFNRPAD